MILARTRQALGPHHDCPPTSISSFVRPQPLSSSLLHPTPIPKFIPLLDFNQAHLPLPSLIVSFARNLQIHPKCLPRPLRKSPPLVARPQQAKPPLRRRRLARKPQRLPATRRSATRRERRPTPRISTKVRFLVLVLILSRVLASPLPTLKFVPSFSISFISHVARLERVLMRHFLVLKQVHPDTGISNRAMSILNSFVNDIFERVATEASKLAAYNKKSTISSREIQTS